MTARDRPHFMREPADAGADLRRHSNLCDPLLMLARAVSRGDLESEGAATISRRDALRVGGLSGLALALWGCASKQSGSDLPRADWLASSEIPSAQMDAANATVSDAATGTNAAAESTALTSPAALPYARPRFLWARGAPDPAGLNPMLPVTALTVHHDGLESLALGTDPRDMADRIELYRRGHRARGWADIGYHLVIDRGGILWQGRSIRWQGAHVQNHNEGNIGVVVMGNFERQTPTPAQLRTLRKVMIDLMRTYEIRRERVFTHCEWPTAHTSCPGRNMQPLLTQMRRNLGDW